MRPSDAALSNDKVAYSLLHKQGIEKSTLLQCFENGDNIQSCLRDAELIDLELISQAIRNRILDVVSKNGGHLSSTLGAVELIVGMHAVFDCTLHPFIFDVSHQAYAHKLLTGRYNEFSSLRQFQGLSGFTAPYESAYDYFIAGHSSTSLSLAVGVAKAKKLSNDTHKPIVMIGDGSMSAGLVYEALNELGDLKLPVVIILNDNEMSIAKPIGAISKILSKTIATPLYQSMKEKIKKITEKMPNGATFIAKRFEESFKLITPGLLFEEFGIDYIGPIDGNNLNEVISTLKSTKKFNRPVLIHCQTIKGKGYEIAEGRYEKWHGVAPFDLCTGKVLAQNTIKSPTAVFSDTVLVMARKNTKIVGVTAAMPSGTGLDKLMDEFPDRFFDVAIAEQHAVTSMAAMAKEGFKPYIAIYSTFLQRAFDQIVHDVCIMNLGVVFCIDRAGIVGEDGETHQGLLDIGYLQGIPNMSLFAPRDNTSLELMLEFSQEYTTPIALRYPRGKFVLEDCYKIYSQDSMIKDSQNLSSLKDELLRVLQDYEIYKKCLHAKISQMLFDSRQNDMLEQSLGIDHTSQKKILLVGYGNGVGRFARVLLELYYSHGILASLLDLVYLKPFDSVMLQQYFEEYDYVFVMSDSYKENGVGSRIMQFCCELFSQGILCNLPKIVTFEIDSQFIKHGNTQKVEEHLQIDTQSLCNKILYYINK